VICGHIHHRAIREIDGIAYVNTGDFVESCSVVVENYDGKLEILYWVDMAAKPSQASQEDAKVEAKAA
jgi:UDP-2,3-diacylglucosamine pyrophosphatase LpxH